MSSEAFCQTTIECLSPFIQKTPLSEKLLSKPPFRFLHDLISEFIHTSEFGIGLFDEDELNASNIKDKDSKISWLTKIIRLTELASGTSIKAKPSKIIAGLDPADTNAFLQLLSKQAKVNTDELVEKCGGTKPIKKDTPLPTSKIGEPRDKTSIPSPIITKGTEETMNDEKRFNDDSALKKETENDLKISQDDISTSSTSLSSRGSSMPLKKNLTPTKETKAKHVESASTSKTKSNTTTKSKTSTSALPTKVSSSSSSSTPRADSTQKVKTTSPPPSSKKSVSLEPKSKPPPYSEPPSLQEREKPLIPSAPTSISGNTPIVSFTEKVEKETESSPHHPSVEISIATSITSSSSDSGSMDPDNLPIYTAVTQEEAEDVRPVTFVKRPATARKPPPKLKSEAVDKGPTTSSVGVPLVDANPEEDMFITANSSIVEPLKYTKSDDSSITKDDLINLRDQIQTLTRCIHPLGKLLDYVQEDMDMMNKEIEKWKAASNDYLQTLITEMEVTKGKLGPMEEELKKIDESIALELEKLDQVKMRVLMNEETMRTLVSQLVVSSH